jgi:hypothetical protein
LYTNGIGGRPFIEISGEKKISTEGEVRKFIKILEDEICSCHCIFPFGEFFLNDKLVYYRHGVKVEGGVWKLRVTIAKKTEAYLHIFGLVTSPEGSIHKLDVNKKVT